MAISKLSKSALTNFDRYVSTAAGNVSATGVFAFADGTSTYRTSPDGATWTSYTTPGSLTGMNLTYHSTTKGWVWWNGGAAGYIPAFNKDLLTPKLTPTYNNYLQDTPSFSGWCQLYAGSNFYYGTNAKSTILDEASAPRMAYSFAPYSNGMCRPAWDGANTWVVLTQQQATYQWAKYTTQGTSGSGIMPVESGNAGVNGWSSWSTYTPPTGGNFFDIIYWSGYWFVMNTSGTIYRTQTITTASPTWTNMGTLTNILSPFFIANNELWVLSGGTATTTAQKLSSPTGSWSAITLPASKQSNNIVYGNGYYVIFNNDGTIYRSATGASGSFSSVNTGSTASYTYKLTGGFGATNG